MDEDKRQQVANNSLIKAKSYARRKNWPRAFAHFLLFLELLPLDRYKYEIEFEKLLYDLGAHLATELNYEDLTKSYVQGLHYFPTNVGILNNFGSYLLRMEEPELAVKYLEMACMYDPNFLLAEKNLQTAKLNIIPRWHFRMLNDRKRNDAYRTAIRNAISPRYNKVLDIGCGCGLLSYYASTSKTVQSVIGIERSKVLADIATNALQEMECVKIINKESTDLNSADIGLSNLLVTEIFDTGLFGEFALETIVHAWEHLLEPMAKIIPHSADLFITGISNDYILIKNKVINKMPQLNLENICIRQFTSELYEAEDLKQKSVTFITNTQLAVNIDFSNYEHLKQIHSIKDSIPPFKLKCINSGTIHALAVWYNLNLDENIMITTNPLEDNVKCWEQAVIYLHHPITLQEDEEITLQLSCVNSRLTVDILDPPTTCHNCFEILPEMITFLNDVQVVEAAEDLELPSKSDNIPYQILDLNPVPLFALFLAKKNYIGNYQCVAERFADKQFIDFLWKNNGFISIDDATPDTPITYEILMMYEVDSKLKENSLDIIFINPISHNGTLCENIFERLPYLTAALKTGGIVLPREVTLQIELMESKYLDFCHHVEEENLLGFEGVATQMNKYSILEQWQVQPQYYQRKTMCNVGSWTNIFTNGFPQTSHIHYMNVPISGTANGVLYWYKIEFSDKVCMNTYKSVHYNGACFVFKKPQVIKSGDTITLTLHQDKGLLKICHMANSIQND